jgi:hypothetical protein
VLNPLDASPPGSVWWRTVNERLLRDGCETIALLGGLAGGRHRKPCGSGWISPRGRRDAAGTERTTPASWPATWSIATSLKLGMAGVFLSLRRVLPDRYPLARDVEGYIADEQRLGRMLDYAVIVPRLQCLYEWSTEELGEPRLLELVCEGNPIYAWPFEQRHVWRTPHMPLGAQVLERVTSPR